MNYIAACSSTAR